MAPSFLNTLNQKDSCKLPHVTIAGGCGHGFTCFMQYTSNYEAKNSLNWLFGFEIILVVTL